MADEIIIRCANCGEVIGKISYIPGSQIIGCKHCGKKTYVEIDEDGNIRTEKKTIAHDFC